MARARNIFVVGLDEFHLSALRSVRHAEDYAFHPLLEYEEIAAAPGFDFPALKAKAHDILRAFDGPVDAIVGYWDFPTTLMLPILRRELGLSGPSLESVLRCEHKYWSRLEQARVVPANIPRFALVDPFDEHAAERLDLPFPLWIKPVKAHSSKLGFRVNDKAELKARLTTIRREIGYFAEPFNHILDHATLPDEVAAVGGHHCIAEQIVSGGHQCTLEGYIFDGEISIYGVVDSVVAPNGSSFERYEYPSMLPPEVQARMADLARTVIGHIGLTESPFNVEFFYQPERDTLWLLEINARISISHSPLFQRVEGVSNAEVMIDIALGRRPEYPLNTGSKAVAAKFMLRRYGEHNQATVTAAPDEAEIARLQAAMPDTDIRLNVHEGLRLGDMYHKDSYSYELAVIFIGAADHDELLRKYRHCADALRIRFSDQDDGHTPRLAGGAAAR